jgi:hypothetical protein
LVARAQALAPKLRDRAVAAEQLRRLPDQTVADIIAAGFTRIVQPSRYGGFDTGWDDLCVTSTDSGQPTPVVSQRSPLPFPTQSLSDCPCANAGNRRVSRRMGARMRLIREVWQRIFGMGRENGV